MKDVSNFDDFDVGFDIPAKPGMDEAEIQTPCLMLDLDALERNIRKMGDYAKAHGMRHRVHGKMHKSVDVAKLQIALGGACGVCCQKVSEAEVFVRGGISDVLVSNQVREPAKIDRLARLPKLGVRVLCCVDDPANVELIFRRPIPTTAENWPFSQPFYFLMNIAVGGNWGGLQGVDDSIFPATMEVDYVRVYQVPRSDG